MKQFLLKYRTTRPIVPLLNHLPVTFKKESGLILLLTFTSAIVEFTVAGVISVLGIALSAPQNLIAAYPVQYLLASFPQAEILTVDIPLLVLLVLSMVCLCLLVKNILQGCVTWRSFLFAYSISGCFAEKLLRSYLRKPLLWHLQQNPTDLATYIQWRVHISIFSQQVLSLIVQGAIIVCLLCGSFIFAPIGTCIVFCNTGLIAVVVYLISRKRLDQASITAKRLEEQINRLSLSALQGVREIYSYGKTEVFSARMGELWPLQANAQALRAIYMPLPFWILETTGAITLLLALMIMRTFDAGVATIAGNLALLTAVSWRILPAANKMLGAILSMRSCLPMLEQILPLLTPADVSGNSSVTQSPMDFINEVSLHELEFYYPNSKTPALRNITLRIPKGCMIGIIGTSGAGKSTLIGILTGLLECGEGQMTVDGFSVTGETSAAWRSNVAYVAQNPYLTDASIAENIAFSFWGMPLDRQKVLHCCRMAAINFIDNLPEGIDTPMGERGVRLSGGQLQRIAIARALYAEPKFLVFDEATSALDDFNETQIQNTINGLRGKQTLIIVAHRLTTVEQCDLVCWLENGELKQSGTPGEILPLFRAYSQQLENERVT